MSGTEIELEGAPASSGSVIGEAFVYKKKEFDIQSSTIKKGEVLDHINQFKKARIQMESELQEMQNGSHSNEATDIIEAQIEMVNDPVLADQIEKLIKEELYSAEFAIQRAFEDYIRLMKNSDNPLARERSIDISDIRDRLLEYINKESDSPGIETGCIVVAQDLSPREVISLTNYNIEGIIMDRGGVTSHAAIIARSLGIPAIVGTKTATESITSESRIAMNGDTGEIFVHPTQTRIKDFEVTIEENRRRDKKLSEVINKKSETSDGHPFILRANIEFPEELEHLRALKASGIGLLRTESIYMEKEHFEDIAMQKEFYRTIMKETGSDPVIMRLFDAGGDKLFDDNKKEQNPFLGWRGIRLLLDNRKLLREQLEAILTIAGEFPGRIKILVPMVTVLEELTEVKEEIRSVQERLQSEGKDIDREVPVGIMVEVPSVALKIDKFTEMVDFVSIGTNDLTQYVLAVDRGNELIADIYNQRHPAVWELIAKVADSAVRYNKQVTVCGELASDPVSAACMLGMGINDLSMAPGKLAGVKHLLIDRSLDEMKQLAEKVLDCGTTQEVNNLFKSWSER
ncbi:phosphoenolpyruvate--protein phosphotransferase [Balneolaceae bacterium YR4-1]|uniref:Phosphoenolpyruvate-protein phosphotransferase n=1 Tax=Halalkalibaculum roseum TaxID=2709311 RepID=A0A6M1SRH8_9BACT|nr:phosphoenolpyruvate--protein phosphotransferase [Halalkalibaculum roseum]NGP78021.1 phosphoenolpyruvate--protein phosphotransferase [Halalkalibaculum roseum]